MATNNQVNVGLSGATGTGAFVGVNAPTLTTPTLGVAAATSVNFGASSTAGVLGTTTNDNADAGTVGEYTSSSILVGSAVSLTTGTEANVTSISLSAGDWDVSGSVLYNINGATTSTAHAAAINTVSATWPTDAAENNSSHAILTLGANPFYITRNLSRMRLSLSGATTVYLLARATFAVSTFAAYGFISARRVR